MRNVRGLALCAILSAFGAAPLNAPRLHLIPYPRSISIAPCAATPLRRSLRAGNGIDEAALEEIDLRWKALGIPPIVRGSHPDVRVTTRPMPAQAYTLRTLSGGAVAIGASSADGVFYAADTLAQLPVRENGSWVLPCVRISDAPALPWRILSDDVSRGPLPTMRYFKERIRTIAAFKMNGYSPYMEHVFVDPRNPLPAPLDGITPAQLRELAIYARRFHVAFIPEQQTFAHMHNTLDLEQYASAAELPHGFLLSPASPLSLAYLTQVIRDELAEVPHPPFFHIGSDETATLGEGQTKAMVVRLGRSAVYAQHIREMNAIVAPSGARLMLWDDGIENDPAIMKLIPKNAVIVNWHYGAEKTFMPYIQLLARGGFQQMVAPGANNWNEIYPDIATAVRNESRFITEGKSAHVFGLFQTVWHDDGESLFEATWYPVLYAAANAWESNTVDPHRFAADFPQAFFGTDDPRYATDIQDLTNVESAVTADPEDSSDYLFWSDPFDPRIAARVQKMDLRAIRLQAEAVEQHLLLNVPPLHANAARVMFLAARKYDTLGRKFQAAQEIRNYYADAQAHAGRPHSPTVRELYWCKYWFWELRDDYEALAPLYAQAWRYENRESHLASNLERYRVEAQRDIVRADDINLTTFEDYVRAKQLPPLERVLHLPQGQTAGP